MTLSGKILTGLAGIIVVLALAGMAKIEPNMALIFAIIGAIVVIWVIVLVTRQEIAE